MNEASEILFQIVVSKQGDKYVVSTREAGSYIATGNSLLSAIDKWSRVASSGVRKYKQGEVALSYLASKLGISEAQAIALANSEETISISEQRAKLDWLFGEES